MRDHGHNLRIRANLSLMSDTATGATFELGMRLREAMWCPFCNEDTVDRFDCTIELDTQPDKIHTGTVDLCQKCHEAVHIDIDTPALRLISGGLPRRIEEDKRSA